MIWAFPFWVQSTSMVVLRRVYNPHTPKLKRKKQIRISFGLEDFTVLFRFNIVLKTYERIYLCLCFSISVAYPKSICNSEQRVNAYSFQSYSAGADNTSTNGYPDAGSNETRLHNYCGYLGHTCSSQGWSRPEPAFATTARGLGFLENTVRMKDARKRPSNMCTREHIKHDFGISVLASIDFNGCFAKSIQPAHPQTDKNKASSNFFQFKRVHSVSRCIFFGFTLF